jgi:Ca2+-binding RTX toxin-like protein
MARQRTLITGPTNGSTTYRFNNKRNLVSIKPTSRSYTLILKGNNDSGTGSRGNDSLDGGSGFDNLIGGSGNDKLNAGRTQAGKQDQNQLLGDLELIKVGEAGGTDDLIGGSGCIDRLIGDALNLYGRGGNDNLQALGRTTELVGDAAEFQASAIGGNDILTGVPLSGTRTTMYGDGISFYGPARGGNDQLISGQSDDHMYGDYQFTFPAPFANDPYIFDIYDQYGFFVPPTQDIQPFVYQPIIFDLVNQDPTNFDPASVPANAKTITFDVPVIGSNGQWNGNFTQETYVIPDRSVDSNAPQGGADQFVFKSLNEGNDVIFDFNPAEGDRIVFTNGLGINQMQAQDNGRDTRITYGTSSILLPYFTGLTANDLLFNSDGIQPIDNGNWQPVVL